MSADYWEQRLTDGQMMKYEAAIKKFRRSRKTRVRESILYDELCACGIYPEEAEDMIKIEVEQDD